ncbi:MAG: cell division protein ZipA C-terminal FtsZ-binding domain-containing protein [Arenicellales bacterium]
MELRTALFIIGMVVIVFIAFISFHRSQQKPYKLPRNIHKYGRSSGDEVDPLFEPRKGPESSARPVLKVKKEPVIQGAGDIEQPGTVNIAPAPLVMDEQSDEAGIMELDLQPSDKAIDNGPQKEIEYVALIRGADPITRDQALGVYRQHEYTMEKRNGIFGFNIHNGLWRNLEHEDQTSEYRDICLTIQLADYKGPVSESELHRFSQMSLEVAEELARPIIFSMDFDEALAEAVDLDRFRKELDVIPVVSIVARSEHGLTMTAIHRESEKLGLAYGEDHIYHRIRKNADNQTDVLFSMANMFKPGDLPKHDVDLHTSGLTFFMRLSTVSKPVDVYKDMIETATTMAKRLNCILVDQETRPVTESMTMSQTKSIMKMTRRMESRSIPAGSDLAKRLF